MSLFNDPRVWAALNRDTNSEAYKNGIRLTMFNNLFEELAADGMVDAVGSHEYCRTRKTLLAHGIDGDFDVDDVLMGIIYQEVNIPEIPTHI